MVNHDISSIASLVKALSGLKMRGWSVLCGTELYMRGCVDAKMRTFPCNVRESL